MHKAAGCGPPEADKLQAHRKRRGAERRHNKLVMSSGVREGFWPDSDFPHHTATVVPAAAGGRLEHGREKK